MTVSLQGIDVSKDKLLQMYTSMMRIRKFEEKVISFYTIGKLASFPHAYIGEEAVGVGVTANLRDSDWITSTHRAEGHVLAKGSETRRVMAELFGKKTGVSGGKGGSMHFGDKSHGLLGATGIVSSGIPIATGAGLSSQVRHTDQVAVSFFGDGAVPSGAFHESLNLAATWNLPVIYVCENNLYSTWTPFNSVSKNVEVASRAAGYSIPGIAVDGMDVLAMYKAAGDAVARARSGNGPTLIEAKTYRFGGHYIGDPDIRTKEEKQEWIKRDPIKMLMDQMIASGIAKPEEFAAIDQKLIAEVDEAVDFAEKSPYPDVSEALTDIYYVNPNPDMSEPDKNNLGTRVISMREAINEAMREELTRDPLTIIYGQGYMGKRGGPFQVGKGLQDLFGKERVRDAPISELTLVGTGLGAAMTGLRPIVEIQFVDFTPLASDQIVNQAAKVRYMFGGQYMVPLTIRTATGAEGSSAGHHSQSLEAWYMHIPGLKVVIPSTPYEAKGLLKSTIRNNNPTLFLETKSLYAIKGPVPEGDYTIPLGKADIKHEGKDVTIVTWGKMVLESLKVAERLKAEGIGVEVVDVRTLAPLDKRTIIDSVKKTGRVVVAHEENKTAGAGAEISAIISEEAFSSLKAPIMRVATPDAIFPYSPPLEKSIFPNDTKIEAAVRAVLSK
ncbi:MAG: pyruvate dehydrogenase complex E1 component subunit beta [Thaumarchaeota archaeon]|nr:pyruvate dehydrogenase complex E1 component subunit beta [Nitrososphaerota archaeon]